SIRTVRWPHCECLILRRLAERGLEGYGRSARSKRSIWQDQHLVITATLLGTDQRRLDVFDRVVGIDRRVEHAVTDLARQIGVDLPHLGGPALGETATEVEPGQANAAHIEGGSADRRILS